MPSDPVREKIAEARRLLEEARRASDPPPAWDEDTVNKKIDRAVEEALEHRPPMQSASDLELGAGNVRLRLTDVPPWALVLVVAVIAVAVVFAMAR